MLRTNTLIAFMLLVMNCWGQNGKLPTDPTDPNRSTTPPELPITLSWDENGVNIRANRKNYASNNVFQAKPSKYLEKVGNDLIRINLGGDDIPVLIDLTRYYEELENLENGFTKINNTESAWITVDHPDLAVETILDERSYTLVLENYAKRARKEIILRGMDVFLVEADKSAKLYSNANKIFVDVKKATNNKLVLRGALLDIEGLDESIPKLCNKYNKKFGETAFICFDEDAEDSEIWNLEHVRDLITKYNITDFEDKPIAYLNFIFITKKGIGFNLKAEDYKTRKEIVYLPQDSYQFFPWQDFLNLEFNKYLDNIRVFVNDPYDKTYIHYSKTHFSNVELVQFLKELKHVVGMKMK